MLVLFHRAYICPDCIQWNCNNKCICQAFQETIAC